jgi:hypothetical protein
MQNENPDMPPLRTPRPQGRAQRRILIEQEGDVCWELVGAIDAWSVERTDPSGVQRFSYDAFEGSADGQRLSNSLMVALARTPKA